VCEQVREPGGREVEQLHAAAAHGGDHLRRDAVIEHRAAQLGRRDRLCGQPVRAQPWLEPLEAKRPHRLVVVEPVEQQQVRLEGNAVRLYSRLEDDLQPRERLRRAGHAQGARVGDVAGKDVFEGVEQVLRQQPALGRGLERRLGAKRKVEL
jgi:hypothetical protein